MLCGHGERGTARRFHLTHGVVVWLCPVHGSPAFLRRRRGRVFAERLDLIWRAAGALTVRRTAALDGHRRRMGGRSATDLPGSYSWPELRREAEVRFASGEDPARVIGDLRRRYAAWPARVPSARTMRRWHADGRWLTGPVRGTPRPRGTFLGIRRPLRSEWKRSVRFDWRWGPPPLWPLTHWWIDDTRHPPPGRWRR